MSSVPGTSRPESILPITYSGKIHPKRVGRQTSALLGSVVGCFLGDRNVVDVALAEAGRGNPDQFRVPLQLNDRLAPAVAHPGAQAADQLVDQPRDAAFVGDAAFDAFG